MSFINTLTSSAKKDMHLHVILTNGESIDGDIISIDEEAVLLTNKKSLSGISFGMLGAWQLDLMDEEAYPDTFDENTDPIRKKTEIAELSGISESELSAFLDGFTPYNTVLSDITPYEHKTSLPEPFQRGAQNTDRNQWDSILSRYHNVDNNQEVIEALSKELLSIGEHYPDCGTFYYNAACFKLKCYDYPDAGRLFEKAFDIDLKSECLYNAAYAYLHEGSNSKALVNLGTYFCIADPRSGIDMWYKFCDIIKEEKDYYIFYNVLREILFKFFILDQESTDLLKLLLQSTVYVFKDEKTLDKELINLFQSINDNDGELTSELVSHSVERFEDLLNKLGLYETNEDFDQRVLLLVRLKRESGSEPSGDLEKPGVVSRPDWKDGSSLPDQASLAGLNSSVAVLNSSVAGQVLVSDSNSSSLLPGQVSLSDPILPASNSQSPGLFPDSSSGEDISFSGTFTRDLKRGDIYRTIPPNKYGFLKDIDGIEYHFKYEDVFGNLGYIDSASDYNLFPVLFKSRPSDLEAAATEETAYLVFSSDLLDNIISLARSFSKERDYPHAIFELKTVLEYDSDNSEAKELLERWDKIYQDRYKENYDCSKINFEPKNEAEWRQKADFLLSLNLFEDAIAAFNHVKSGISSSLYGQGLAYLKTGRYEEAIESFNRALEKSHGYYHATYARGLSYQRQGDYEHALQDYNTVIALRPDYQIAWKQKAFALGQLEYYEESLKAYDMSLSLDPRDWTALSMKSSILTKQNRLHEAMECVEEALKHLPDHPDSLFAKGYILQKEKRFKEALTYFEKSLEKDPNNVKALTKKAYVLAILGKHTAAAEAIENAVRLNMDNSKSWYYRGVVFHYAGDYEKAVSSYLKSLELQPGIKRVVFCKEKAEKKLEPLLDPASGENEVKDSPESNDSSEPEPEPESKPDLKTLVSQFNRLHP